MSRISPVVLIVIVILAVVFFIFGLLNLLFRCLLKRPSFSSISQSNGFPETSHSNSFQRQLQQLFHLHDSGLDQALIDALPVFYYKDVMGLKGPFDCAVCLCEFSDIDKLRLLPMCSHAFHIDCIDTWLLSNSTCPLCRGLISSGLPVGNPIFFFENPIEQWGSSCQEDENESFSGQNKPRTLAENTASMRVFSIRLGKFRNLNGGAENIDQNRNEVSSSNVDARRCFSMGAFQYIVDDSELQVALPNVNANTDHLDTKLVKSSHNADRDGKKINTRSRGDSFSVSKIWLWSKKDKFPSSSNAITFGSSMPDTNRISIV